MLAHSQHRMQVIQASQGLIYNIIRIAIFPSSCINFTEKLKLFLGSYYTHSIDHLFCEVEIYPLDFIKFAITFNKHKRAICGNRN